MSNPFDMSRLWCGWCSYVTLAGDTTSPFCARCEALKARGEGLGPQPIFMLARAANRRACWACSGAPAESDPSTARFCPRHIRLLELRRPDTTGLDARDADFASPRTINLNSRAHWFP